MGPDLWELFEDGKEDDDVAAIIRLGHYAVVPKGVRVVTQFNEIITVRIKRGDLLKVSGAPEVDSMLLATLIWGQISNWKPLACPNCLRTPSCQVMNAGRKT